MTKLRSEFLALLRIRHVSKRTVETYEKIVEELAYFHNKSPLAMTVQDIQEFLSHCVNIRKFSPASTNLYISALRTFYKMMDRHTTIMDDFRKIRLDQKIPQLLEREELEAIFKAISNIKHRAAIMLLYSSGLRIGECCHLKIADIESSEKRLRVNGGKGMKDRYTVLSERFLPTLREYYKACRPKVYLFEGSRKGSPISDVALSRALKEGAQRAGIKKPVYPHLLRHCFASHLLENGVPLAEIQKVMGHNNLRTTAHYAQVTERLRCSIKSPADFLDAEGVSNG